MGYRGSVSVSRILSWLLRATVSCLSACALVTPLDDLHGGATDADHRPCERRRPYPIATSLRDALATLCSRALGGDALFTRR